MDPNEAIRCLRELILQSEGLSVSSVEEDIRNQWADLDAWLSAGGAIPREWRGSVEKILTDMAKAYCSCAAVQQSEGRSADASRLRTMAQALDLAIEVIEGRQPMPKFRL